MKLPASQAEGCVLHHFDDLEGASDAGFQERWLTMMIDHHEGAIEMARDEQDEGHFGPAIALAESIETSQAEEIELMEAMLDR